MWLFFLFQNHITQSIPQIFDAVFECTLAMINKVCVFVEAHASFILHK